MTREDTITNISSYYKVKANQVTKVVKKLNSDYRKFKYKRRESLDQIFPENLGAYLHIDEVAVTKGELYTYLTNPEGKAKKKTIVAIIQGTSSKRIIEVIDKLALVRRKKVKVVALDMALNMQSAMRKSFPNATLVIDKFHVVKLVIEALQSQRIKYRWQVLDQENKRHKFCRKNKYHYVVKRYSNGDTEKQLLARSVHLLYKSPNNWTESQEVRAAILFENYPLLKILYEHCQAFRRIYSEMNINKAKRQLENWIEKSKTLRLDVFQTVANSIENHFHNITNYFKYRVTNAFAESFNSKIKRFRFNQRGVLDDIFFQYRLTNLFA